MAVWLEGGCRVTTIREGEPVVEDNLKIWRHVGRDIGAQAISLRVLECARGLSKARRNPDCDEVLYVLEGRGVMLIDGRAYDISPETGVYIRPGEVFAMENPHDQPLVLVSCQCPEPEGEPEAVAADQAVGREAPEVAPIVRLADRRAVPTADRWYRVLVDEEVGSAQVTQFVGSIPPGRAPDHYHNYEEVLFILRGEGRMWAGKTNTPIAANFCVYLPKGQTHCVENTGNGELRLLGVFYPAGSPAVRYE